MINAVFQLFRHVWHQCDDSLYCPSTYRLIVYGEWRNDYSWRNVVSLICPNILNLLQGKLCSNPGAHLNRFLGSSGYLTLGSRAAIPRSWRHRMISQSVLSTRGRRCILIAYSSCTSDSSREPTLAYTGSRDNPNRCKKPDKNTI